MAVLVVDGQLALVPFTRDHVPQLVDAVRTSSSRLQPWMFWATEDYGEEAAGSFADLVESGAEQAFVIRDRDTDHFHGLCALNRVDHHNRMANLGYWLRTGATGHGFATRAARRLLAHGLRDRGLERVELITSVENRPGIAVAGRLGLAEEGIRARAVRVGDEQHDARVFAAFESPRRSFDAPSPVGRPPESARPSSEANRGDPGSRSSRRHSRGPTVAS